MTDAPLMDDPALAGILPDHALEAAFARGWIDGPAPAAGQIQPASLDLRLGRYAHRLPFSFLPGRGRTVAEALAQHAMHRLDLERTAVLERGCVYLVELEEALALPARVAASANPKSSTGRLDVFARVVAEPPLESKSHVAVTSGHPPICPPTSATTWIGVTVRVTCHQSFAQGSIANRPIFPNVHKVCAIDRGQILPRLARCRRLPRSGSA